MVSRPALLLALLALCAVLAAHHGTNAQSDATADEVGSEDNYSDERRVDEEMAPQYVDEAEPEETREEPTSTTPRPGFFQQFSFPTLPTFSFPAFPTLPSFPTLPPFPSMPSFPHLANMTLHQINNLTNTIHNLSSALPAPHPRPTIIATQTLFVEVTRRVTRVPVCMTVQGVRPPCNMPPPSPHSHHQYRAEGGEGEDSLWTDIEPTAAYKWAPVQPTLMPEEGQGEREGKYLELRGAKPLRAKQAQVEASEEVEGGDARVTPELTSATMDLGSGIASAVGGAVGSGFGGRPGLGGRPVLGGMHRPVTSIIRRTLHVTRVETVTDTRVTATLIADNCVPNGLNIPYCSAKGHRQTTPQPPRPPPTTARPTRRPTTKRPYTTTSSPYTTTSRPYTTTSRPYPTTKRPYPTTKRSSAEDEVNQYDDELLLDNLAKS